MEAAVLATIELESYLEINSGTGKDSVPSATQVSGPEPLAETLRMLNKRLEKLEVLAVSYPSTCTQERLGTRAREQSTGGLTCWNCGKKGHVARKCWSRQNAKRQGNFSPSAERASHGGPMTAQARMCVLTVPTLSVSSMQ